MPTPAYPRGSEWRKWDLQVHTPFSALNNGFGNDFSAYAKALIERACEDDIAVVGITDYFTIQGYTALKALLADDAALKALVGEELAKRATQILFLPNIELRLSTIVRNPKGADSRVNLHVIFSDSVLPDHIEEHFFRELKFTAEANAGGEDERWALNPQNLAELGKRLKAQHANFQGQTDMFVGMMNAIVDHSEVSKILEGKPSIFKDRYLLCLPCDEDLSKCSWDGQGHLARKLLIQKSHILLSSNDGTRAFAHGKRHSSLEAFKAEFKTLKPCIHSSDAHTFEKMFRPDEGRHTWIKADPTFHGLRQILNEPEDRVFVGNVPPSVTRARQHATRVATIVDIKRTAAATITEKWFDTSLPLNNELVAVIGNKGSGKSALSDIIGLLGNTQRYESFSFLKPAKFRHPKNNKSRHFEASLTWADGTTDSVPSLDVNPSPDAVEKVKYIPQSYLEDICNEIGSGKGGRFYSELQQVIFSHVPEVEQLGFGTLDELLAHRSEETNQAIAQLVANLQELNALIVATEERSLPQHRKAIEAQLAEKQRELNAHTATRPAEVPKPDADPTALQQSKATTEELEKKQADLKAIELELASLRASDLAAAKKQSTVEKLAGKLKNLERHVDAFLVETKPEFDELGITAADVVTFRIDPAKIKAALAALVAERETISAKLAPETADGPEFKRKALVVAIEGLQAQLSAPQRAHQAYLQSLKDWETGQAKIIGSEDAIGSIKYMQKQLAELDGLPAYLKTLRKQRDRKLLEIFREKQKLRAYYETYYGAVQSFLKQHPLAASERFRLTFNVAMAESGFAEAFLSRINRRKAGPFMGDEEGATEMKRLLDNANFDSALGTLRFTKSLLAKMTERDGKTLLIKEQLRQGVSVREIYDYVFSLEFLSPIYKLQWDGKDLEQLSPGERGNLLLIFYLLVDRNDIPLVIDQPEENLDNQTVFKTLVPCIKDAKKRRQIVMVTHNPNLAVVCDAEQVICAEMMKDRGNAISYISGSIEDPVINAKIVDILEGTRPAFDKRDDKYHSSSILSTRH
jgi:ABC-type lipoprotein export system ATPase subunit